ncbi:protein transport protein SEC20, putative [Babesia caballi]|uniref:Protein transport protein SEC20, putative n=1 Tax=Babesia caballi TaxID=5871 RepID=A0AAV4LUD9_BABCB|nr:protein transport protein SEC20, putative [Babesia caballi]
MASIREVRISPKVTGPDLALSAGSCRPNASAEQLDSLYFRERDAPKHGQVDLSDNAIYELCQLDASLEELFRDSDAEYTSHQQIHKFRLRVSRRISAFAGILRKLHKYSEATASPNSLKLQSLHRFYMGRLMWLVGMFTV